MSRRARWIVRLAALLLPLLAYALWSPGVDRTDGRHDRRRNGAWLAHGWLGDDAWFTRNGRDRARFRDPAAVAALVDRLRANHIVDLFPHLCPVAGEAPAPNDAAQTERLLDASAGLRVIPWIGGVFERHVFPDDAVFRRHFAGHVRALLDRHPRLAGVQLNVEPWPSGHAGMLQLLDEIRAALPPGRVLSVAAYPPPTRWQSDLEVHWTPSYLRAVARRVDQVAVMMYDTAIPLAKPYESLMARWTREVLRDAAPTPVLLGVPTYDDADKPWHRPWAENLPVALRGLHRGLGERAPAAFQGVAVYAEWETDVGEWRWLREHFLAR
jgi:hypothetical protein